MTTGPRSGRQDRPSATRRGRHGLRARTWRRRSGCNLDPQSGHEQAGRRPALVLSPLAYNAKVGLAIFCPITNQVKGYAFEVVIPSGVGVTGAVLSDQVKNLDWRSRQAERICPLPESVVATVLERLELLIS